MQVGTHDGVFHADDVFAGALLRLVFGDDLAIVRTRNVDTLAQCALCFDVGGGVYDHHQPGGNGARDNGVPYAAFGLLWQHYGPQACGAIETANEVDRAFVQAIDAHDNGFVAPPMAHSDGTEARPFTISYAVSSFNPDWSEPQDFDACYAHATAWALPVLERAIVRARGVVSARSEVRQAVEGAIDPRVVVLERFVPWQEALCAASKEALLVVYPSAGTWRVQVVPTVPGQPGARIALPATWAGLDGAALAALTGVADATFAHRQRFIAGAGSREGAYRLAMAALEE